jgi:hypothetical protein
VTDRPNDFTAIFDPRFKYIESVPQRELSIRQQIAPLQIVAVVDAYSADTLSVR